MSALHHHRPLLSTRHSGGAWALVLGGAVLAAELELAPVLGMALMGAAATAGICAASAGVCVAPAAAGSAGAAGADSFSLLRSWRSSAVPSSSSIPATSVELLQLLPLALLLVPLPLRFSSYYPGYSRPYHKAGLKSKYQTCSRFEIATYDDASDDEYDECDEYDEYDEYSCRKINF